MASFLPVHCCHLPWRVCSDAYAIQIHLFSGRTVKKTRPASRNGFASINGLLYLSLVVSTRQDLTYLGVPAMMAIPPTIASIVNCAKCQDRTRSLLTFSSGLGQMWPMSAELSSRYARLAMPPGLPVMSRTSPSDLDFWFPRAIACPHSSASTRITATIHIYIYIWQRSHNQPSSKVGEYPNKGYANLVDIGWLPFKKFCVFGMLIQLVRILTDPMRAFDD